MAELVQRHREGSVRTEAVVRAPSTQAFRILHFGFIAAPTIAGLDKFFHLLVNWDQYLAPAIARMLPMSGHTFMLIVGVIEIAAGLLVALKPKIGGLVVAVWLAGIILNLLIAGNYFDIALRDFGLMLGALALSRLASQHEHVAPRRTTVTSR
jgi:hypothetical protein